MHRLKYLLGAAALLSATPAMASDFSSLIYIFLFAIGIVVIFAAAFVFALRSIVVADRRWIDAVCAAVLGLAIAPAGFVEQFGETTFVLFPGWMLTAFEFGAEGLFPGYLVSLCVTCTALFVFFRKLSGRKSRPAAKVAE